MTNIQSKNSLSILLIQFDSFHPHNIIPYQFCYCYDHLKSHHIHLMFHSFILFFVHLSSALLLLQCRVKSYHQLIIICRLQHEESLSLNDIVHHDVKYHSRFSLFTDLNPLLKQSNQLRLFIKLSSFILMFH